MALESKTSTQASVISHWNRVNPVIDGHTYNWSSIQYNTVSRSGASNSDWKSDIRSGRNATTAYEMSLTEHISSPAGAFSTISWPSGAIDHYQEIGNIAAYAASVDNYWLQSLPPSTSVESIASGKFLRSIRDAVSPFKGAAFLGELKETLAMIKSPLQSFRRGLDGYVANVRRHARRGMRRKALSRAIAGTWLEYTYGWVPLLNDIKDAINAFDRFQRRPEFIRVFGKADEVSDASSPKTLGIQYPGRLEYDIVRTYVTQIGAIYVGAVKLSHDQRDVSRILELSGFSLQEFIPTIWELIPYSFLVDYFTNVGDIIGGACTATQNVAWHSRTVRTSSTCRWHGQVRKPDLPGSTGATYSGSTGAYVVRRLTLSRSIPSLSESPSLVFSIPGFGTKWLNIAALATMRTL